MKQALEGLHGVHRVAVSYQAGKARVEGEAGKLQVSEILAAVRRAGGYRPIVRDPEAAVHAAARKSDMEQQGERISAWSALAAVGIGIVGRL
ncbi:MAG: cation transporter [candidate division NC10 bacterium]|nr:cation transporter [candidate division NC10 bacterium]